MSAFPEVPEPQAQAVRRRRRAGRPVVAAVALQHQQLAAPRDGVYDLVFVDAAVTETGQCVVAALRLLRTIARGLVAVAIAATPVATAG